jgi:hypothetical protein
MKQWIQEDWSGGENTLLSPELIADNEAQKIVNLLPRRGGNGLTLRKGFQPVYDNMGDDVYGLFIKRKSDSTRQLIGCVKDGTAVKVKLFGEVGGAAQSETFTASTKMTTINNPQDVIQVDGAAYTFYEEGKLDYWGNDGSLWDDGTAWSAPDYGYIEFTIDTYSTGTRFTVNTDETIGQYKGSVLVYYKKSTDVSYTTLGTFQVEMVSHSM